MARLIQSTIKTPLADEVLFGRLKDGGAVRVVVVDKDGKTAPGFEFPEGPVTPKPEKAVAEARKARDKRSAAARKGAATRKAAKSRKDNKDLKGGGGTGGGGPGGPGPTGGGKGGGKPAVRTVPKVPLARS
jgi:ATP-dependent Clp protease ATP-binding subunit ClpA